MGTANERAGFCSVFTFAQCAFMCAHKGKEKRWHLPQNAMHSKANPIRYSRDTVFMFKGKARI